MMQVSTIPSLLRNLEENYRKPSAFRLKENGKWVDVSTIEFVSRVEELFFGLRALGIKAGDRTAILSENRVDWAPADYASASVGESLSQSIQHFHPLKLRLLSRIPELRLFLFQV